jgi:hypothetical protein
MSQCASCVICSTSIGNGITSIAIPVSKTIAIDPFAWRYKSYETTLLVMDIVG